jgi:hypothetical protein
MGPADQRLSSLTNAHLFHGIGRPFCLPSLPPFRTQTKQFRREKKKKIKIKNANSTSRSRTHDSN